MNFKGFVDHYVAQQTNAFSNGVLTFKQNTIEALANYTQTFPMGTGLAVNYEGQRYANNSPYEAINPSLYSNFQVVLTQQLLAGFGISTNERYMHIAKKNLQITDLAFRAQVIATVTQVENIYWDLVNAYQDEQVKERSLCFCPTHPPGRPKQLELQAIPAMLVNKDQSDVATSEGDLTVSRANLRLNELLLKNAITKTDDAAIDEMPVIPLDRAGPPDPNAAKAIDALIAEAEKNRPDVTQDELAMQVAAMSLKSIRSELLPTLNVYGFYAGAGIAGPKNPNCDLSPAAECSSDLPTGFGRHVPEHLQLLVAGLSVRHDSLDQPSQSRRQGRSVSRRVWNSGSARSPSKSRRRASASTCATRCSRCSRRRPASMPPQKRATWRSIPSTSPSRSSNSARNPAAIRWPRDTTSPLPNPLLSPRKRRLKRPRLTSTGPPARRSNEPEFPSTMRKWESYPVRRRTRLHERRRERTRLSRLRGNSSFERARL